jgi:hypothetical protein
MACKKEKEMACKHQYPTISNPSYQNPNTSTAMHATEKQRNFSENYSTFRLT